MPDEAMEMANKMKEAHGIGKRPEPLPLMADKSQPPAYPLEALGPVLGGAAKTIADCVQCPDSIAGQSVLAAASLAVQGFANVVIDGRCSPASLFCLTVADSGDRKSHADVLALAPHKQWEKDQRQAYKDQMVDFNAEMAAYKSAHDKITKSKNRDRDDMAHDLKDLGPEPAAPPSPTLIMSEPTFEAIQKGFRDGLPSQGLFSDEGGQFFGGHSMGSEHKQKTISGLSGFWGGDPINRSRAGDGESFSLYDRRLSVHMLIQPVIAEQVLSDPLMTGQGFMARFLIAWPDSIAGGRPYNHLDATKERTLGLYNQAMSNLLNLEKPVNDEGEPELGTLVLSDEAKALWVATYNTIERALSPDGELREIKATASKAAENMARMAAVLTLTANPHAKEIALAEMEGAATLIEFYLAEAVRLNDVAETDIKLTRAKYLLDWLHKNNHAVISMTQISRSAPRNTKAKFNVKAARQLVNQLVEHGWMYPLPDGIEIGGKPVREAWEIVSV